MKINLTGNYCIINLCLCDENCIKKQTSDKNCTLTSRKKVKGKSDELEEKQDIQKRIVQG